MTRDRDTKRAVRARMRATGERYTQARSALFGSSSGTPSTRSRPDAEGGAMVGKELLESLDRDGFAVVRGVVPQRTVDELRHWLDELVDADLDARMREAQRRREAGDADARAFRRGSEGRIGLAMTDEARLSRLVEGVTEIVHAIGTPRRGSAGMGACLPGWGGHDGLHQDLPGPAPKIGSWDGVILTFPLSPGEAWEGMRVVPGSHRRETELDFGEGYATAVAPYQGEIYVEAGPGDVIVNSIHIYKSATLNRSTERRSEIWVAYRDGEETASKIRDYWAGVQIKHGDAPAEL